jgi:glutamate-1-semialdehyde aminotransferase
MGLQGAKTSEWFDGAAARLINGVSSQFRYWEDDETLVIDRGEGGHVYDMDVKLQVFEEALTEALQKT